MSDPVNKPAHYNQGGIETIDSIRASTGDGFIWYCVGNADKYIGRCRYKGKLLEDLRKCRNYVDWAIEEAEKLEAAVECGNCPVIPDSSSRRLRQCCSPIAIPTGWRELEPDEVPEPTDMHEWMGGWFYRGTETTHQYKFHGSRHVRKIETDEPKPLAIPEGWRELEIGEALSKNDLYCRDGKWNPYVESNPAGSDFPRYSKGIHYKHIRKIETANPSETPNSSTWIPRVGDRVRVKRSGSKAHGKFGIIVDLPGSEYAVRMESEGFTLLNVKADDLQLIEAAS